MKKISLAAFMMVLGTFVAFAADPTADLKKADQDWAQSVASKNIDQFISFVADDVYASGIDGKWVHGRDAMKAEWAKMLPDPGFKLSWTVDTADISKDLGYTRGTFQGSRGGQSFSGSYATVWKKDKSGKWKAVVDIATPTTQQQ